MHPDRTTAAGVAGGFTIIELAIALMIGSILIGIAIPNIQSASMQREVNGARDGVMMLSSVARASAMDRARSIEFTLNTTNGTAMVVDPTISDTIEVVRLNTLGVAATATPATIKLCYTSRGYATTPCSTALGGPITVRFERGSYSARLEVWPLGQVRKL